MNYKVQLDSFQGPLELLYQLVKKNKIEINKISLAKITGQYLDYIDHFQEFDLETASEFMVIASELIELKAGKLLPTDENEQVDKSKNNKNIVQRLQEYQLFKNITTSLSQYEEKANNSFTRPVEISQWINDELKLDLDLKPSQLKQAFEQALKSMKEKNKNTNKTTSKEMTYISEETIKVEDKIQDVLKEINHNRSGISFYSLVKDIDNHLEIVVTLLSILELIKINKISVKQDDLFSNIKVSAEIKQVV